MGRQHSTHGSTMETHHRSKGSMPFSADAVHSGERSAPAMSREKTSDMFSSTNIKNGDTESFQEIVTITQDVICIWVTTTANIELPVWRRGVGGGFYGWRGCSGIFRGVFGGVRGCSGVLESVQRECGTHDNIDNNNDKPKTPKTSSTTKNRYCSK